MPFPSSGDNIYVSYINICFSAGSDNKVSVCLQGRRLRFDRWEDPLEKEMATHSSTLAWKIPWMEESGGL